MEVVFQPMKQPGVSTIASQLQTSLQQLTNPDSPVVSPMQIRQGRVKEREQQGEVMKTSGSGIHF